MILGLTGLAVTQPLLDLFGRNPEFFVAGNYSAGQIVWFALVVAFVPPLVGIAVVAGATLVGRPVGMAVYAAVVALLATTLVLSVLRWVGVDRAVVMLAFSLGVGAALTLFVVKTRGGTLLVSYLAVANLLFVGSFLFFSPTSELVAGDGSPDVGGVDVPPLRAPVVVVVLDEVPAATIMRADGTINAERYPGFAELAAVSTWFRNASSPAQPHPPGRPRRSSPARSPNGEDLPTYGDHPAQPVHAARSRRPGAPLRVGDRPVPAGHLRRADPASRAPGDRGRLDRLRPPGAARGRCATACRRSTTRGAPTASEHRARTRRPSRAPVRRRIAIRTTKWRALAPRSDEERPRPGPRARPTRLGAITARPALHVVHVPCPTGPWVLSRTGVATVVHAAGADATEPRRRTEFRSPARVPAAQHAGRRRRRRWSASWSTSCVRMPAWEDTLLVVTSDHGTNLTPPDIGRDTSPTRNREEVYRVPLFIKAPGQDAGEIRRRQRPDHRRAAVDRRPARRRGRLGVRRPLAVRRQPAHIRRRVSTDVEAVLAIAAARAEEFPYGDDWIGPGRGRRARRSRRAGTSPSSPSGPPSELRARRRPGRAVGRCCRPATGGAVRTRGHGHRATGSDEPAGGLLGRGQRDARRRRRRVPPLRRTAGTSPATSPTSTVEGRNEVVLYEVARHGGDVTLRPVL